MIEIRRASLGDEASVLELYSRLVSRQRKGIWAVDQDAGVAIYRQIVEDPDLGVILVAVEDSDMLGVISLSYPVAVKSGGRYARIEEYIVDDKARGKGVGTSLLDAAIKEASKAGCYDLQVNNPSDLGKPLYLRQNFVEGGDYMKLKL